MNIFLTKKSFVSFILLAFFVVGLFGLFHFAMDMNNGGDALGCSFMNIATLCAMNPFTHIATWQNMFASSFPKEIFSLLALALLIALFAFTVRNFLRDSNVSQTLTPIQRLTTRISHTKNSLQEAFSSGILNPKLYSSLA